MSDTQRNFLIVGAIAVLAVTFSGPFGITFFTVSMLLNLAFAAMIVASLWILHRNHASAISSMPARHRLLLQSCGIVLAVVVVTGMIFPGWSTWGLVNVLLFLALVAGSIYGIYYAWQQKPLRW